MNLYILILKIKINAMHINLVSNIAMKGCHFMPWISSSHFFNFQKYTNKDQKPMSIVGLKYEAYLSSYIYYFLSYNI